MLEVTNGSFIEFDYMNWRGFAGHRRIKVQRIYFGSTEYHPEIQWLLEGIDMNKNDSRIFAMKDMSNVVNW
jgi:hypothetical protein